LLFFVVGFIIILNRFYIQPAKIPKAAQQDFKITRANSIFLTGTAIYKGKQSMQLMTQLDLKLI